MSTSRLHKTGQIKIKKPSQSIKSMALKEAFKDLYTIKKESG